MDLRPGISVTAFAFSMLLIIGISLLTQPPPDASLHDDLHPGAPDRPDQVPVV
jgi:hypothetical protein